MKTYTGITSGDNDWRVTVDTENKDTGISNHEELDLRLDLANHSPDGFSWGYHGSGPAQLALALLADLIGDDNAKLNYGLFKTIFVAPLDQNEGWVVSDTVLHVIYAMALRLGNDRAEIKRLYDLTAELRGEIEGLRAVVDAVGKDVSQGISDVSKHGDQA